MNTIDVFQNEIKEKLNFKTTSYQTLDYEHQGWIEQAVVTPYLNAEALMDIQKLPEGLSLEELYKLWVNALNEMTYYNFLIWEYKDGRLFK